MDYLPPPGPIGCHPGVVAPICYANPGISAFLHEVRAVPKPTYFLTSLESILVTTTVNSILVYSVVEFLSNQGCSGALPSARRVADEMSLLQD